MGCGASSHENLPPSGDPEGKTSATDDKSNGKNIETNLGEEEDEEKDEFQSEEKVSENKDDDAKSDDGSGNEDDGAEGEGSESKVKGGNDKSVESPANAVAASVTASTEHAKGEDNKAASDKKNVKDNAEEEEEEEEEELSAEEIVIKEKIEKVWKSLFKAIDTDRSGSVQAIEISKLKEEHPEVATIVWMLETSDSNEDELISKSEWLDLLDKILKAKKPSYSMLEAYEKMLKAIKGETRAKKKLLNSKGGGERIQEKDYLDCMRKLWPKIFKAFDQDKNGTVETTEIEDVQRQCNVGFLVNIMKKSNTDEDGKVTSREWAIMFDDMIAQFGSPNESTYNKCLDMYKTVFRNSIKSSADNISDDDDDDDDDREAYLERLYGIWPRIWDAVNQDSDDFVDYEEMMKVAEKCDKKVGKMFKLMEMSDENKDDKITKLEWMKMLECVVEKQGLPSKESFEASLEMYKNIMKAVAKLPGQQQRNNDDDDDDDDEVGDEEKMYHDRMQGLWSRIFRFFDNDRSGYIESMEIMKIKEKFDDARALIMMIEMSDSNKDNKVSRQEWNQMFQDVVKDKSPDKKQYLAYLRMYNTISGDALKPNEDVEIVHDDEFYTADKEEDDDEDEGNYSVRLQQLWPKLFRMLDKDKNGFIKSEEINRVQKMSTKGKMLQKLLIFGDSDEDHQLSMKEWNNMFEKMNAMHGAPSAETFEAFLDMYRMILRKDNESVVNLLRKEDDQDDGGKNEEKKEEKTELTEAERMQVELHNAIRELHFQKVSEIFASKITEVIAKDSKAGGYTEVAADIKDKDGNTCLHVACTTGNKKIVKTCLRNHANVNAQNNTKSTPLHILYHYGSTDLAKYLIKKGAKDSIKNDNGLIPKQGLESKDGAALRQQELFRFLKENRYGEARRLLQDATNNPNSMTDENKNSCLHLACQLGDIKAAKICIKAGCFINGQNVDGQTPMHFSCHKHNRNLTALLKKHGAQDTIINKYGFTPYEGLEPLNKKISNDLLRKQMLKGKRKKEGKDHQQQQQRPKQTGENELIAEENKAARGQDNDKKEGHNDELASADISSTSKEKDMKLNKINASIKIQKNNSTGKAKQIEVLFKAAVNNEASTIKNAFKNGIIKADEVDGKGNTILHIACQIGSKKIIKHCLRFDANINAKNNDGQTPLHYLFANEHQDLAKYLASKGADDSLTNKHGLTPFEGLRPQE